MKQILRKLLAVAAMALFGATAQADDLKVLGTFKDLPIGESRDVLVNVDGKKADDWFVQGEPAFVTTKVTKNFDRTCTVTVTATDESADALSDITVWRKVGDQNEPVGKIAVSAKPSETMGLLSVVNVETKGLARGFYIDYKLGDFKFEAEDNGQAGFCETELKASVRDSSKTLLKIKAKEFSAHSQRLLTDNPTYYVMKKGWFNSTYKANTIVVRTTAEQAKMRLTLNEQSVYHAHSAKARQWRWSSSLLTADGVKLFTDATCSEAIPMSCKTTKGKWNDIYARIEASSYVPGKSHVNLNMIDSEVEVQGVDIDIDIYRPVVKNERIGLLDDDTVAYIPLTWGPGDSEYLKFANATNSLWRISSEDGKIATADKIVVHPTMLGSVAALKVTAKDVGTTTLYATDGAYEFTINLNVQSDLVEVKKTPVEGVTTKIFYNGEEQTVVPFNAITNTPVQFVYTINEAGYAFADGSTCRTQTVCCVNNPTTDSDAPAACKLPTVTTVKLTNGEKYPYDLGWRFEMDEAGKGQYSAFGDWDAEFYISCDRAIEDKTILFATIQPVEDDQGAVKDDWVGSEMPELDKNEEIGYFDRFLGTTSTYAELCDNLGELSCAVRNHSAANMGLTVKVVLRLTKEIDGKKRCICVPICPFKWLVHHLHRVARPCCHPWVCNHKPCADGKSDVNCPTTSRSMELAEVKMLLPSPTISLAYHNPSLSDLVRLYDFNKDDDDENGAYWEPKASGDGKFSIAPTNCTDTKVFGLCTEAWPTKYTIYPSTLEINRADEIDEETMHLKGDEETVYKYGLQSETRNSIFPEEKTSFFAFSQSQNDWKVEAVTPEYATLSSFTNFDANTIHITVEGKSKGWAKFIAYNTNKVFCASCKRCGPCGKKHCHFCKGVKPVRPCTPFLLHPPCVRPFFHHAWMPCHTCKPCTICRPCTICKVAPCMHRICSHHDCPHGFFCTPAVSCSASVSVDVNASLGCGSASADVSASFTCTCSVKHVCGPCCKPCSHKCNPCCPQPEPQPQPEPEPECTCYTAGAYYEFYVEVKAPRYPIYLFYTTDKSKDDEFDENYNYTEGIGRKLPETPKVGKPGYIFLGWYANRELTGDPVTKVGKDETGAKYFWAKWASEADALFRVKPADVAHTFVMNVTTNAGYKVAEPDYKVRPNANVTIQYGADKGYWFVENKETFYSSTFTASADPTEDPNESKLIVEPRLDVTSGELHGEDLGDAEYGWNYKSNDKKGDTLFEDWICDWYISFDKAVAAGSVTNYVKFNGSAHAQGIPALEAGAEFAVFTTLLDGLVPTYGSWLGGDLPTFVGVANISPANAGTTVTCVMRLTNPDDADDFVDVDTWSYEFPEIEAPKVESQESAGEQPEVTKGSDNVWDVKFPTSSYNTPCSALRIRNCCPYMKFRVPAKVAIIHGLHQLAAVSLVNHLGHVIDSKYVKGFQPDGSFSTELTAEAKKTVVTDLGTTEVDGKMKFKFETKPGLVYNVVGAASLSAINSKPDFSSGEQEGDGGTLELDVTAAAKGQKAFFYSIKVSK